MTSVSYTTLLADWFRVHVPLPKKPNPTFVSHTGYAGAYPEIQWYHRRQGNLFSCIPLVYKSKKRNQKHLLRKKNSSIKGCASFARFDTYQEGDIEDDC
jgi:hypothetical protein